MPRYVVVVIPQRTFEPEVLRVRARCPEAAYAGLGAHHRGPEIAQVRVFRRGLRRHKDLRVFGGGLPGQGPGDPAGVREPRRPRPTPPSLRLELDQP